MTCNALQRVADNSEDRHRLVREWRRCFADENFDEFMFRWYIARGKFLFFQQTIVIITYTGQYARLVETITPRAPDAALSRFVADKPHMRWHVERKQGKYFEAAVTLAELGVAERDDIGRKRTLVNQAIMYARVAQANPQRRYAAIKETLLSHNCTGCMRST